MVTIVALIPVMLDKSPDTLASVSRARRNGCDNYRQLFFSPHTAEDRIPSSEVW